MRVVSALLLLVASSAWAFDAVVFSNDQVLSRDFPSFDNLVSTATVESPLIVLTLPGFNLGQFSKAAQVYTDKTTTVPSAVTLVKSAKSHVSRFLKNPIELTSAAHITSTTEQIPSAPILVAEATDWLDLDTLLSSLTPLSGSTWTAVLTSNDAVSVGQKRVKRVSTSALDDEGGPSVRADNNGILAPLLLPPFTRKDGSGADVPGLVDNSSRATWGDCLFYLEGFDIVTYYYKDGNSYNYVSTPIRKFTYDWSPSYVKCPIPFLKDAAVPNGVTPFNNTAEFVFEVDATTTEESRGFQPGSVTLNATSIAAGTKIHFRVTILYHLGWYNLTRFELLDSIAVKSEDPTNYIDITGNIGEAIDLQNVGLTAANDAGWVCSVSQAAFVAANSNANASAAPMKGDLLGVELVNAHIQLYGISWPVLTTDTWNNTVTKLPRFSYQAHDCNGAFSTASWMGIISSLVMVTILLFGYLMLQSVQTMDRFDDPKAKQILINVRE